MKNKPIRIIGGGCIGLAMACELERAGFKVSGISADDLYNIASWRAAGYFAFVSVKTSKAEQENLNDMGYKTLEVYHEVNRGEHPYLREDSVRFIPVYCSAETDSGIDELVARGCMPDPVDVTLDFGNGVVRPNFKKYMTYFIDTTNIMLQLHEQVARLGIPIQCEAIGSFDEVEEEIIFDCSGVGARELNEDNNMVPVRGHLVYLNELSGTEHMDYMIYTQVEQDGNTEYVYMFPKALAVSSDNVLGDEIYSSIGGTFILNTDRLSDEELENLDRVEFKRMLDRNTMFFSGHNFDEEK